MSKESKYSIKEFCAVISLTVVALSACGGVIEDCTFIEKEV